MAQEKIMNLGVMQYYDEKIKAYLAAADAQVLTDANAYADGLASNYDAAGTAQTKVDALANGQVKLNKEAIEVLNGGITTEGSVDKKISDAKTELTTSIGTVNTALETEVERAKAAEKLNSEAAAAAKAAADAAQSDVDAVELDMGDVDGLSTTNKTVVGAINEVLAAVGTGGTAAVVTLTTETTTDGALKSYTLKQGDATVGVIDIPKDMVVESGEVVTNPEGMTEGTYIKLVLANVAEPLFINVGTLVDIYKAKANATQVQVAIDPSTREISATIVAGSITSVELADNAVVTAKIADANVTKAKLSTAVQASLDKADAAAPQTALDAEKTRAEAAEAQALVDAKAYADGIVATEKTRAEAAEAKALADAKTYADGIVATEKSRAEGIESGLDTRLQAVEAKMGSGTGSVSDMIATAKQEAIDAAATDATTKANKAEANAKSYTDSEIDKVEATVSTNSGDIATLKTAVNETLPASIAEAKKAGTDAQGEVDALETVVANLTTAHGDRLTALETKVGDGWVAITTAEIDEMFA